MQSLVDLERTSSLLYLRLVLSFIIFYVLSLHICAWSSHLICLETGNRSHKIKTGAPPLDPLLAELVQVETYEQLQAQVPHLSVFFSQLFARYGVESAAVHGRCTSICFDVVSLSLLLLCS